MIQSLLFRHDSSSSRSLPTTFLLSLLCRSLYLIIPSICPLSLSRRQTFRSSRNRPGFIPSSRSLAHFVPPTSTLSPASFLTSFDASKGSRQPQTTTTNSHTYHSNLLNQSQSSHGTPADVSRTKLELPRTEMELTVVRSVRVPGEPLRSKVTKDPRVRCTLERSISLCRSRGRCW